MKTNTTTNLASVVALAILSPVLAMAILVSVKTAGVLENDVLLVLLTLLSAVLSGINGFGRRTAKPSTVSQAPSNSAGSSQAHSVTWSTRQSTNA
jgi:hypothetical protein